jgi:hypothetical protein
MNYIANGEVGLDISPRGNPKAMKITFSSQPGFSYGFPTSVKEEGEAALELAYALTVHKAQGSQFKKVILVIAEPCRLLSTEMLYTALTRQTGRVVILYNAEAYKLRNYSLPSYSDIVRRFTCLFVECPKIVKHAKGWYDENLIHRTIRGDLVRSKSEVIIANMLHDAGIAYEYEKTLDLGEDGLKSPDFTMEDAESGTLFYWEHCGMMSNDQYRKRWEEKKAVYEKHGIIEGENLIVSYDDDNGSIDSIAIKALIEKYLK